MKACPRRENLVEDPVTGCGGLTLASQAWLAPTLLLAHFPHQDGKKHWKGKSKKTHVSRLRRISSLSKGREKKKKKPK